MKLNISPKVTKIGLTLLALGLTYLGGKISDGVKQDERREEIAEIVREELSNQVKES